MIDFGVLEPAAAQAYCDAYAAAVPDRVAWLEHEVTRTGGPPLRRTPDDLVPAWEWAWQRLREPGGPSVDLPGRPPWYSAERANPYLSDGALWLVDALGCYLATLAQDAVPEARWGVHRVAKRLKDVDQQRTMLMGLPGERPADPTRMVYGEVIGPVVHGEPVDPRALRRLYDALVPPAA